MQINPLGWLVLAIATPFLKVWRWWEKRRAAASGQNDKGGGGA